MILFIKSLQLWVGFYSRQQLIYLLIEERGISSALPMTKPSARNRALPSFSKIFDFVKNGVTNSDLFSWLAALNRLARFARLRPLPPIRFLRRHRFFFSFHVEIEKKKRMGGIISNYFLINLLSFFNAQSFVLKS